MGTPIDYQMPLTPPARQPRNVWFGAVSALSAGSAWLLLMVGPPLPEWLLNGVVAVFCIFSFIPGIVGLKRGVASMILSIWGSSWHSS